jgi:hypothetical protein
MEPTTVSSWPKAHLFPWFLSNGYAVLIGALVIGNAEVMVRQRSSG